MKIGVGLRAKSGRSNEPGLHVTVRVPEPEATGAGLVRSEDGALGPCAGEFAQRLSDAAHSYFDEEGEGLVSELEAAYKCLDGLLGSTTGAVTEGAIREVARRLLDAIGAIGMADLRRGADVASLRERERRLREFCRVVHMYVPQPVEGEFDGVALEVYEEIRRELSGKGD